ncbi:MAG: bifunctional pyr operon transcriptional regulator/uracil phosphoribosyltransferase PyrR [Candidatus Muiribacterium halophilum]|uniref:Bifunctional protein PyrR n=1 Tax=Muiribacterium halophilum TaxID=2053465 RepID=A0A2N5ZHP9_MUIH1|nr:MAG: bifunctional pyr operon transcriptional regulator/uracil phosphoribosyltransferase PyrR [Candidatus Muirbacterium halophilum]
MISKTVIEVKEFERILKRIALQIIEKNINRIESLAFIGIRKRGVPLAKRLASYIKNTEGYDIPVGELDISLYRDDQTAISNEPILSGTEIDFSFSGKNLIIIDDILQSGKTARAAMEAILDHGRPESIELGVIVDTRTRTLPMSADYYGKRLPISKKEFVRLNLKEFDQKDSIEIIKRGE